MTKEAFIAKVAEKTGSTKANVNRTLQAITETIIQALSQGDKITFLGFGTFSVSERSERTGTNPRSGEKITIPAAKVPKFKASSKFKEALNK